MTKKWRCRPYGYGYAKVIIITSDFDGANLCDYLSNCLAGGHVTITPPPPFHSSIPIVCKR